MNIHISYILLYLCVGIIYTFIIECLDDWNDASSYPLTIAVWPLCIASNIVQILLLIKYKLTEALSDNPTR